MIIRTCEGSNQAQRTVMARQLQFPARIGLACVTQDQMGGDVGGGIDPVSSHCSISYGADVDLQQNGRAVFSLTSRNAVCRLGRLLVWSHSGARTGQNQA